MRRDDEGIAPILAVLLLLGLVVAFMGAWNSTVIPTMKEEAELIHTGEVEDAFVQFSASVSEISRKMQNGTASVTVPLGGGETLFDATRTAGTIRILPNIPSVQPQLMRIDVEDVAVLLPNVTLASVVYQSQNTFWQNQGYGFEYGYVNVTRENISVPLQYGDMQMLAKSPDIQNRVHTFLTVTPEAVRTVSWRVDEKNILASGNGHAVLSVSSRILPATTVPAGKKITIQIAPSSSRPDWLVTMMKDQLEADLNGTGSWWMNAGDTYTFTLTQDAVLEQMEILFSVR